MPTLTITYKTDAERQAYERAIAFVAEMYELGLQAPEGRVLDACEAFTLSNGRDFLRETLAGAAQARIVEVEKKSSRPVAIAPAVRDLDPVRS
jgi:hypothetical protein